MKVYFSVLWWLQEEDPVYLLERHEVRFLKGIYIRNVDVCFEFLSTKKWNFCTWQIISGLSVDWLNPETYSVLLTVRTIWCEASKQYWHKMFDCSLRRTRDQKLQPSILKSAEIPFLSGPRLLFKYCFLFYYMFLAHFAASCWGWSAVYCHIQVGLFSAVFNLCCCVSSWL